MTDEINTVMERVIGKAITQKLNQQGGQAYIEAIHIMVECLMLEELRKLNKSPPKQKTVHKTD